MESKELLTDYKKYIQILLNFKRLRIKVIKTFVLFAEKPLRSLRLNALFLTIMFCVANLNAQQNALPITLEKAVELAKTNNAELKIADKEIEKQTVLKKTAFQADPLQIEYQGGQMNSKAFDYNVSVMQYFPTGNSTKYNRQLQEELAKLAEKRKAITGYELEKAVTLGYYQYLFGVSVQKLNEELKKIYTQFLKNAELRYNTGESGKIEVISAKAKVKEIETQQEQLALDLEIYQKQLQYFVQTDSNIVPDNKTPLQYVSIIDPNKTNSETLIADYYNQQLSVYQKEQQTYKSQGMPKLGLGLFTQSIDKTTGYKGFTAGLQIPIFNNGNSAKAKATEISQSQTQLEFENSKLKLKLQLQKLQSEFEKQKKGIDYYNKEGLQYAEQIIDTAQKSYANGDMSYWTYIGFLNQAIDIKKQYAETLNSYNQSAIQLQFPSFN